MSNDDLIKQIKQAVREEVKAETEPINKRLDSLQAGQERLEKTQQQQGKILVALTDNMATVLTEQQQQRTDIRSLHTELHESEERQAKRLEVLKAEILAARTEVRADSMDLKATVIRRLKEDEKWIEAIAEKTDTSNPNKH